ncbi:hypothetical protein MKEN_01147400 [Mycena kentingensis (nom. inval.)]|nr:hypothetical protein MKEN_01147400 [Mycena kentingensis (nom. inval.)]
MNTLPHEIVERIAFISATSSPIGPPTDLVGLLSVNRHIYSRLSFNANQYLYARIYHAKFDVGTSLHHPAAQPSPSALAHQLRHRCRVLSRIRARSSDDDDVHELLFHAYLMMLENVGKNERQLRDYARMGDWLRAYLFEDHLPPPSQRPRASSRLEHWPPQNDHVSLAMWLFWFLLRPDDFMLDDDATWNVLDILKIYALGAHKYPLTDPCWVNFLPDSPQHSTPIVHYSEQHNLRTPPLATPAILSFLTLVNLKTRAFDFAAHMDLPLKPDSDNGAHEWEFELGRCLSLSRPEFGSMLTESFRSGSVQGTWEGIFTYTEFTAYAALLQGAPPPTLQKSVIVRHKQTWKLREHHLLVPVDRFGGVDGDELCKQEPLSAGDPLRAYLPTGTLYEETEEGLSVRDPVTGKDLWYSKAKGGPQEDEEKRPRAVVRDIIIKGEGHSAWGQFNLIGRVRPCDGFISLCKEYTDHDRGKWIYRGYLVGNVNSNLAGRWRDTLSPAAVPGYEGCFLMSRRRAGLGVGFGSRGGRR